MLFYIRTLEGAERDGGTEQCFGAQKKNFTERTSCCEANASTACVSFVFTVYRRLLCFRLLVTQADSSFTASG